MNNEPEKRDQLCGAHLTRSEKKFVRIIAATEGQTTSTFIRQILADALSKVDDENNPFKVAKN
ncbi:hypothetical protein F943_01470 [Acinetobacter ursingii NIPH 706]|uniref:hypothetical protein n=1 Tax=Acinetobacter ursingii TaxID=108980 RepID=UPI0002CE234F|nr:hypothetical protein [Acinetobacter ursingii]ENX49077.1 hypothetical protein F943_01470 [Acinetobacter ursingii NIPH 706]